MTINVGPGDNKEFTSTAVEDITVYFQGGESGNNTSANDTQTIKYFDNNGCISKFFLRNNQTVLIVSINGIVFTNPTTVLLNKGHVERWDAPIIYKMVIRTTIAGTNIKIRTHGR